MPSQPVERHGGASGSKVRKLHWKVATKAGRRARKLEGVGALTKPCLISICGSKENGRHKGEAKSVRRGTMGYLSWSSSGYHL